MIVKATRRFLSGRPLNSLIPETATVASDASMTENPTCLAFTASISAELPLNGITRIWRSELRWMTFAMTCAWTLLIAPGGRVAIVCGAAWTLTPPAKPVARAITVPQKASLCISLICQPFL